MIRIILGYANHTITDEYCCWISGTLDSSIDSHLAVPKQSAAGVLNTSLTHLRSSGTIVGQFESIRIEKSLRFLGWLLLVDIAIATRRKS